MSVKKILLIGFGRMGQLHFKNLKKMDGVDLIGIIDKSLNQPFIHDVPVYPFSDADHILSNPQLDACLIATPSNTHFDWVKLALRHKKHIFCEKPVSLNIENLMEIKREVDQLGLCFHVGLNRRFDPDFYAVKKAIEDNKIGNIQLVKIVNRDPLRPKLDFVRGSGGLFFDFNIHDFDMVHYLTNQKVTQVHAIGNALIEPKLKQFNDIDTAIISLKLLSGAIAVIDTSRETNYGYDQRLEIFGSRGMLQVNNIKKTHVVCLSKSTQYQGDLIKNSFVERFEKSYQLELNAFLQSINGEIVSQAAGIDNIIDAVIVAQRALKSLSLPPLSKEAPSFKCLTTEMIE